MFTKATSGGTDEMRELLGTKMGTSCTPFGLSQSLYTARGQLGRTNAGSVWLRLAAAFSLSHPPFGTTLA